MEKVGLAIFYLAATVYLVRQLSHKAVLFSNLVGLAFIGTNCLGLFLPASAMDEFGYSVAPEWLTKTGLAYIPFVLLIVLYNVWVSRRKYTLRSEREIYISPTATAVAFGLIVLASALIIRHLFLGGFERVMAWQSISDRASAYEVRFSTIVEEGKGYWTSGVAAFAVIPTLACYILCFARFLPFSVRLMLLAPPLLLSLIRSLSNLQRAAPLLQILATVLVLYIAFEFHRGRSATHVWRFLLKVFVVLAGCLAIGGAVVYTISDGTANPLFRLLQRIFVIPSHTGSLYFGFFPDVLDYRGIQESFDMLADDVEGGSIVTVRQIGFLANGYMHIANANPIATAYTGAGFLSSSLISLLLAAVICPFSFLLGRFGTVVAVLFTLAQIQVLLAILVGSLLSAVASGFIGVQLLAALCFKYLVQTRVDSASEPQKAFRRLAFNH